MTHSQPYYLINCSEEDLRKDIRSTTDPIRKTILKYFLEIKIREMRAIEEDPSLDGLTSDGPDYSSYLNEQTDQNKNENSGKKELENILKKQNESLSELEKLSKIKAYIDIIEDNKRESNQKLLEKSRGKTEKVWGVTYDPMYAKYIKEDTMNNKLMERLNSEIEFRNDDIGRSKIEKPFDDGVPDTTETFARYETSYDESKRYIPKKPKSHLGQRKSFY